MYEQVTFPVGLTMSDSADRPLMVVEGGGTAVEADLLLAVQPFEAGRTQRALPAVPLR